MALGKESEPRKGHLRLVPEASTPNHNSSRRLGRRVALGGVMAVLAIGSIVPGTVHQLVDNAKQSLNIAAEAVASAKYYGKTAPIEAYEAPKVACKISADKVTLGEVGVSSAYAYSEQVDGNHRATGSVLDVLTQVNQVYNPGFDAGSLTPAEEFVGLDSCNRQPELASK